MTDPSACQDWHFRPARNYFNFGSIKKSHGARSMEHGRWGKKVTFSFFKNAVTIVEVWAGTLSCRIWICLKPMTGRRFWKKKYFFQFLQYHVLVVLSSDAFALFHRHFYCDSFTREEKNCIQNRLCTQRPFGNYPALAVLNSPYFIASLSDGLKIMDPSFLWRHWQTAFCHKLETFEAAFWPL